MRKFTETERALLFLDGFRGLEYKYKKAFLDEAGEDGLKEILRSPGDLVSFFGEIVNEKYASTLRLACDLTILDLFLEFLDPHDTSLDIYECALDIILRDVCAVVSVFIPIVLTDSHQLLIYGLLFRCFIILHLIYLALLVPIALAIIKNIVQFVHKSHSITVEMIAIKGYKCECATMDVDARYVA